MSIFIKMLLPLLVGPLSGVIGTYVMDLIDDVLKWTTNWPNPVKQILVVILTAALPVIGQLTGITLPTDPANLATQPVVQSIVAAAMAFFLKHANSTPSTPSTPATTK